MPLLLSHREPCSFGSFGVTPSASPVLRAHGPATGGRGDWRSFCGTAGRGYSDRISNLVDLSEVTP
jgi:hypothetical protein